MMCDADNPAPCKVIPFEIVTVVVHVNDPAGIVTVSPSMAVCREYTERLLLIRRNGKPWPRNAGRKNCSESGSQTLVRISFSMFVSPVTIRCKFLWLSRLFRKTRKNFAFKSRESPSRRMYSADQPDSLPGTRGQRRFAAKSRYADSQRAIVQK